MWEYEFFNDLPISESTAAGAEGGASAGHHNQPEIGYITHKVQSILLQSYYKS